MERIGAGIRRDLPRFRGAGEELALRVEGRKPLEKPGGQASLGLARDQSRVQRLWLGAVQENEVGAIGGLLTGGQGQRRRQPESPAEKRLARVASKIMKVAPIFPGKGRIVNARSGPLHGGQCPALPVVPGVSEIAGALPDRSMRPPLVVGAGEASGAMDGAGPAAAFPTGFSGTEAEGLAEALGAGAAAAAERRAAAWMALRWVDCRA